MSKLIVVDGNSIVNRAFYGIMGGKMLQTADGTYTNAVYGFLAILFKELDEVKPDYMAIAFDLKAPTARHKMYDGYKANRKGMPDELASQMPILKDVLRAMNITIIEREGYEADDVLGTLSRMGEKAGMDVVLLTGDRDSFQLATDRVSIYIPRTKAGKTETDIFDRNKVLEVYGVEPKQMIEVKGLQGDTSDNIPGVPGIGEKTALSLVKKYGTIEHLYECIESNTDDLKGKQREKIADNKELAMLSKTLGTINLETPIDQSVEDLKIKEWNKPEVLKMFKELKFNRYIDRFNLRDEVVASDVEADEPAKTIDFEKKLVSKDEFALIESKVVNNGVCYFYIETVACDDSIIKKQIKSVSVFVREENTVYDYRTSDILDLKGLFENENVLKCSYDLKDVYILAEEAGILPKNFMFDIRIAGYLLNSTTNQYSISDLMKQYLEVDIELTEGKPEQLNLFDVAESSDEKEDEKVCLYAYAIGELHDVLEKRLKADEMYGLFTDIEMPVLEVLADMQYRGMYVDKNELIAYGDELKERLNELTAKIHELAGEEFNINSTKQLGEVLFEKLKLPVVKKTKSGYSTDVDTLEKLECEHEIISYILEYRQLAKLNSTYIEGLIPYINKNTGRIHSYFHQTVTATGRISSTEPNLQNIPTRIEIGKKLRKVFKPAEGKIFLDADYSQIELRVLAHVSQDEIMVENFNNDEDIHAQAASRVFGVPLDEVTKELRSKAKAVNFGIVYGISDFGLAGQIHSSRKEAKQYIEQYLEKYSGIKKFMDDVVVEAKEKGFIETMYKRRRYIPELKSKNYMVRKFGDRVAMNTPIQGTAADIMKIAMINVFQKLREEGLNSKIVLQVHDELLIETDIDERDKVKEILVDCMENAAKLLVPLKVEVEEGENWYDAK